MGAVASSVHHLGQLFLLQVRSWAKVDAALAAAKGETYNCFSYFFIISLFYPPANWLGLKLQLTALPHTTYQVPVLCHFYPSLPLQQQNKLLP